MVLLLKPISHYITNISFRFEFWILCISKYRGSKTQTEISREVCYVSILYFIIILILGPKRLLFNFIFS